MSDNDLEAFLARMKADQDFRERLLEPADPEARLEVARREGYLVTLDELGEHAQRLRDSHIEHLYAAGTADCPTRCDLRIEPE